MADKLTIHINVEGSDPTLQTVSKFAVSDKGHITIYNDAGAMANIRFADASPLCQGNSPQLSVDIDAGSNKQFKVCNNAADLQYKYTATVAGAAPEDPIIWVDKAPIIWVDKTVIAVVAGLVIGALIGYLIARRRATHSK